MIKEEQIGENADWSKENTQNTSEKCRVESEICRGRRRSSPRPGHRWRNEKDLSFCVCLEEKLWSLLINWKLINSSEEEREGKNDAQVFRPSTSMGGGDIYQDSSRMAHFGRRNQKFDHS